jgi:hypothetical protein
MERFLFQDQPLEERRRILRDSADKIEETTYLKPLSEDELSVRREAFTEGSIKLGQMEDELEEVKEKYKEKMKPLKDQNKEVLYELKHRQAAVTGPLFLIADHDEGMMGTYDENGELISSRKLRPEEKQLTINHLSKAQ